MVKTFIRLLCSVLLLSTGVSWASETVGKNPFQAYWEKMIGKPDKDYWTDDACMTMGFASLSKNSKLKAAPSEKATDVSQVYAKQYLCITDVGPAPSKSTEDWIFVLAVPFKPDICEGLSAQKSKFCKLGKSVKLPPVWLDLSFKTQNGACTAYRKGNEGWRYSGDCPGGFIRSADWFPEDKVYDF